jgi:hypothetical protein
LADQPKPIMSHATTRKRAISSFQIGSKSYDALGKPWMTSSAGRAASPSAR